MKIIYAVYYLVGNLNYKMHLTREEKIPNAFVLIQGIIDYVETFARINAVITAAIYLIFTQMLLALNLLCVELFAEEQRVDECCSLIAS